MSRNAGNNEGGYRQGGEFDESGEFGENDEFDDISPKIEIRAKFAGFVEVAALSVAFCRAHSL